MCVCVNGAVMVCVWGGLAGHAGTVGNKEPSDSSVLKCTLGNAKRKAKRVAYLTAGALPVVRVCVFVCASRCVQQSCMNFLLCVCMVGLRCKKFLCFCVYIKRCVQTCVG